MHVRFTEAHDYTPTLRPQVTIAYRAGWSGPVRDECGRAAIKAGKAVRLPAPARKAAARAEA